MELFLIFGGLSFPLPTAASNSSTLKVFSRIIRQPMMISRSHFVYICWALSLHLLQESTLMQVQDILVVVFFFLRLAATNWSYGAAKVFMNEYTPLAAPSDNSDKAKHEIPNDDVFHMVLKEIQQLRKEHADLKHKVDGLYETIIVNKDDEAAHLKENVDILYGKINHSYDTKPKDTSDHKKEQHTPPPNFPSVETDVSPPAQRHIVKVSSKDNSVKSQYPMGKHSPTPSWENESVPTFKDCALDDDYLLGHNTIPRLIDEEKRTIIAKASIFRYGPFHLSVSLNALNAQIIEYVYSEDLPQSETIVSTSRILVNRNSFRTLEPTMWVDSEIINLVADNNTHVATRKQSSLYWYLPTQFAMISLDNVLATEIKSCFGPSFSFQSFNLDSPEDCPTQPNFYDCGIFVCMFMDERSHATSRKFQNTFNSVA
ncbi:hypothetical protein LWI28_029077 [Acer negundo]|uniref:Ubiquitin-like protease family profile domain-containing protein n=1 Tax=Acer negundo TaxID=4023 RepID=A0AAD5J8K3_ACENE|nr:hypothetical protein LWI28_029077 [Acer negundo]